MDIFSWVWVFSWVSIFLRFDALEFFRVRTKKACQRHLTDVCFLMFEFKQFSQKNVIVTSWEWDVNEMKFKCKIPGSSLVDGDKGYRNWIWQEEVRAENEEEGNKTLTSSALTQGRHTRRQHSEIKFSITHFFLHLSFFHSVLLWKKAGKVFIFSFLLLWALVLE